MVDPLDNEMFQKLPGLDELRAVVFFMDAGSAPSPDRFGAGFYQHCWDIIKDDLLLAVQDFFRGMGKPKGFSSALIVLIPSGGGFVVKGFSTDQLV